MDQLLYLLSLAAGLWFGITWRTNKLGWTLFSLTAICVIVWVVSVMVACVFSDGVIRILVRNCFRGAAAFETYTLIIWVFARFIHKLGSRETFRIMR